MKRKLNNDQGVKVWGFDHVTDDWSWYVDNPWSVVEISLLDPPPGVSVEYMSADSTPWDDMDRLEVYRTGSVDGDASESIGIREVKLCKAESTPSYCAEWTTTYYEVNGHECNCGTCQSCGCHSVALYCDYDTCDHGGCWCSPICKCCTDSACSYTCDCETCYEQNPLVVCTDSVTYGIASLQPDAVPAAAASPASTTGGLPSTVTVIAPTDDAASSGTSELRFVFSTETLCRFGPDPSVTAGNFSNVVTGEFVNSEQLRCVAPDLADLGVLDGAAVGAIGVGPAGDYEVAVAVSLDGGQQWTNDSTALLRFYWCEDDCNGNGVCNPDLTCACDEMHIGDTCQFACPLNGDAVCSSTGVCTATAAGDGAVCSCHYGFGGVTCETECDAGLAPGGETGTENYCSGADRGICNAVDGNCHCFGDYTGPGCEIDAADCETDDCGCTLPGYWGASGCTGKCPGTEGGACDETDGCEMVCSDHGACSVTTGTCACDDGFYGSGCAYACDCSTAHSTCTESGDTFVCVCGVGYFGDRCDSACPGLVFADTDDDSGGAVTTAACSGNGDCNSAGTCMCVSGWTGDDCATECSGGAANPCAGNGACLPDGTCTCDSGFWSDDCSKACPTVDGGDGTACDGHGYCNGSGECQCDSGYWGAACDAECPGGAAAPCSGHGSCHTATGSCYCTVGAGWFGDDCSQECPGGSEHPCSNHGVCDQNTGECICNAGYGGASCSDRACINDCYGQGDCVDGSTCVCYGGWQGDACSVPLGANPNISYVQFDPVTYFTSEEVGTVFLNVTRTGRLSEDVMVHYRTIDVSATSGEDYLGPDGTLTWEEGTNIPQTIQIDILANDRVEGEEIFEVQLYSPVPQEGCALRVGSDRALVRIQSKEGTVYSAEGVFVTFRVHQNILDIGEGTKARGLFEHYLMTGVALAVETSTDRVVVADVSWTAPIGGDHNSLVTFEILPYDDDDSYSDATAGELATAFVKAVGDVSSAVYSNEMDEHVKVDISMEPIICPTSNPTCSSGFGGADSAGAGVDVPWLVGTLGVVAAFAIAGGVAYHKRRPLSEYLLWRLAAFRFRTLREEGRDDEMAEMTSMTRGDLVMRTAPAGDETAMSRAMVPPKLDATI